jgi:dTDP-4-amino-4,6-dideoxygalactose transaminase
MLTDVSPDVIPFSRTYVSACEHEYLSRALASGHLQGDGPMTEAATRLVEHVSTAERALLTPSCTHALEMAAILLDLGPGDEVVVPSFTFSSTAAAVALRGATPVFADIDPDTLNLDPDSLEASLTRRTRAAFVVHYGGVGADMRRILAIAGQHDLRVVEDNAHGLGARWQGQQLGTLGALATQSFHATKNIQCGEGGALLVNDGAYMERAEVVREKGTDRSRFLRGQVDKYTWNDTGSSYLLSELQAAVLRSQLESFDEIQRLRHRIWTTYAASLRPWADVSGARLMHVPAGAEHPAHVFYVLMPSHDDQQRLLAHMRSRGVGGTFHYIPLDSSPAGERFGRTPHPCAVTHDVAYRLVRLPLFAGLTDSDVDRVVSTVSSYRPVATSLVSGQA